MAKKAYFPDPKAETVKRIQRTEAYAEKVRQLFAATVNEILALNKSVPTLDEGVMYSFDGDNMRIQKKVEALFRQLHSVVTTAIRKGITLEWEQANVECDKLIASCFGKKVLSSPEFSAWNNRNMAAMNAFADRTEDGLNLSGRIWQSVQQLRDEMEIAMTVAIGEGDSAQSISRKVRQYLNDPDLMFRRFRFKKGEDEQGKPIYGRKWKKRIKDEKTGKYRWIDYDRKDYKTGSGVYKSSAKNAMRVARSETNIAYRRADNERWQQMDFVLGQRIQLSKNHPKKDICDKLAGDYPKDFVFDGWHVQCFCFATPILIDEAEMAKVTEAFLKGEKYTPQGKQITEYPANFKNWVQDNKENILASRDRGTEPYFIRNNASAIDEILNPKPKELTIAEKAALRHEARTPEQEAAIRSAWAERQKKHQQIKTAANNIAKVAGDYGEVDYSALQKYIDAGDLSAMQTETKKVAQAIIATKKAEQALADIIPNAHSWHKQFTMAQLQGVYDAVKSKIEGWTSLSLEQQAKKLHFEAYDFLGGNMKGVQEKYPTWKVSQEAYIKEYHAVSYKIAVQQATVDLAAVKQWSAEHPKSLNVAKLLAEAEQAVNTNAELSVVKSKTALAVAEYQKRLAEQARRDAKKIGKSTSAQFGADAYTQKRKDAAFWTESREEGDRHYSTYAEEDWKRWSGEEKHVAYLYTSGSRYINEPLFAKYYGTKYSDIDGSARNSWRDINTLTSMIDKAKPLTRDVWMKHGEDMSAFIGKFGVDLRGLTSSQLKGVIGKVGTNAPFTSCGITKGAGFSHEQVILNIYCPKGTKGIYTEPYSHYGDGGYEEAGFKWDGKSRLAAGYKPSGEMEFILQRGTKFRITKIEKKGNKYYIDVDLIEQPAMLPDTI